MPFRPTRPLVEPAAGMVDQHQKYNEHPFLMKKDYQFGVDVGKTCFSFGAALLAADALSPPRDD